MNETTETGKTQVELTLTAVTGLKVKLEKLNKRAAKLGVEPVTLTKLGDWKRVETVNELNGEVCSVKHVATFEITTNVPKLAGWSFVATIDHLGDANLIKTAPHVDDIDLSKYRFGPAHCDWCNKTRNRKDTYVIKSEAGALRQVGSNCLCDVLGLGVTPEGAISWAQWISEIAKFCAGAEADDDRDVRDSAGINGGYGQRDMVLFVYCSFVEALIQRDGYRSRKYAEASEGSVSATSTDAVYHMDPPNGLTNAERAELVVPTEDDEAFAKRAIEWAASLESRSDFDHNIKTLARCETVERKNKGIAAYIVAGYRRHLEREVERKAKAAALPPSSHVGEVGKRLKAQVVTYLATPFSTETQYGPLFIHKFRTAEGNDLVWKTSSNIEDDPGIQYTAAFTPKAHDEFNGRAQTVVSRMKLAEVKA